MTNCLVYEPLSSFRARTAPGQGIRRHRNIVLLLDRDSRKNGAHEYFGRALL